MMNEKDQKLGYIVVLVSRITDVDKLVRIERFIEDIDD